MVRICRWLSIDLRRFLPTCLWLMWLTSPVGIAILLGWLINYGGMDEQLAEIIICRYLIVGWPGMAVTLTFATIFWLPKLVEEHFGGSDRD